MQTGDIIKILALAAVAALIFWLWRRGDLLRVSRYVEETREELRKCTWPDRAELKGSTVVVLVSVFLLSVFTIGVDALLHLIFQFVTAA
jgi:preprotein translocase SecE subunit